MNIFLEADCTTYTAFCPVYSPGGRLTSVEMLTHFTHAGSHLAMPQEIMTALLNDRQRVLLLQQQINLLDKHSDFFSNHEIKVAINIDMPLARTILESEFILKKMRQLDCIELEISESFPGLNAGRDNSILLALSEKFNLSLNNYGAGKTTSKAVFDDLFYRIKLDRGFIQHNIKRLSFHPFISAILDHVKPHCQEIVIQGADDLPSLQKVRDYPFDGIQSALFPSVCEDELILLTQSPVPLRERVLQ
ncbi:EAL domain-containing protein [Erwinia persicina]|uniref:EAL domain-containing protein n=1 Tax=Erwinia persicina TaxID=55211 RepID=UPI001785C591|nr:EAL domain-containing protein [Erwinia persicina]MBD8212763.1 EAL domain-containing protein [Erwinia persicina]